METLLFTNSCLHRKDTTHLKFVWFSPGTQKTQNTETQKRHNTLKVWFSPGAQDVLRLPVVRINMGCRPSPSPPGIKMSRKKV